MLQTFNSEHITFSDFGLDPVIYIKSDWLAKITRHIRVCRVIINDLFIFAGGGAEQLAASGMVAWYILVKGLW